MNDPEELFKRCVRFKRYGKGVLLIECRLGLWSVEGRDHDDIEREARHYWIQYFTDGEYEKLLCAP